MSIDVRVARPADAAAVAASEAANLGDDAWSTGLVAAGLASDSGVERYLVAHDGETVVGHAVVGLAADVAELRRIAVDAAVRRQGTGSALLAAAVETARAVGATRMLLEVRDDNEAALGFYAQRGFVEVDRRRRYYGDGASAVVMRLALRTGCG